MPCTSAAVTSRPLEHRCDAARRRAPLRARARSCTTWSERLRGVAACASGARRASGLQTFTQKRPAAGDAEVRHGGRPIRIRPASTTIAMPVPAAGASRHTAPSRLPRRRQLVDRRSPPYGQPVARGRIEPRLQPLPFTFARSPAGCRSARRRDRHRSRTPSLISKRSISRPLLQAAARDRLWDRVDRRHAGARRRGDADRRPRTDLRERRKPFDARRSRDPSTGTAAVASLRPAALPAVTVKPGISADCRPSGPPCPRPSPRRGCSSVSNTPPAVATGTI